VYYGVIVTINIAILVISVLPATRVTCDSDAFSYQFYVVCGVDLVQSILISYFVYQLKILIKRNQSADKIRFSQEQRELLLEDDVRG
jgi:Na+-transporting NADH:ubiquinone oxidoreductase subunit NqrC